MDSQVGGDASNSMKVSGSRRCPSPRRTSWEPAHSLGAYLIEENERRDLGLQVRALTTCGNSPGRQHRRGRERAPAISSTSRSPTRSSARSANGRSSSRIPGGRTCSATPLPPPTDSPTSTYRSGPVGRSRRLPADSGRPAALRSSGAALSWEDVAFNGFPQRGHGRLRIRLLQPRHCGCLHGRGAPAPK